MKATGATDGTGMGAEKGWPVGSVVENAWVGVVDKAGGLGVRNGWKGGVDAGCRAQIDLVTSSSQRSASDGVRRWDGCDGEAVVEGGATITGVVQSAPVGRKHQRMFGRD